MDKACSWLFLLFRFITSAAMVEKEKQREEERETR